MTHVVFDFQGGGMESLVADMAARLRGSSVSVSLITLSGRVGRLGAMTRDRFDQFHVVRPLRGVSMLLPINIAHAIRKTQPHVVHLHSGAWFKGAWAARIAGAPRVIYTEHGREHDDPPAQQFIDRQAARLTSAVVSVSERLGRYLARQVRVPASKIVTIHNGVDTAIFSPGPAPEGLRASLHIPDEAVVIGSVGRMEKVKAYDRLLECAALLRRRIPQPFVVVICGDGSQREALQARAVDLGVEKFVRFPGWLHEPLPFYRLLDVFVLCSRSEGQSVSLMEAMACGVPPVVTDVGANAEMLGSDLGHHVVPVERPDALADAIIAVLAARDLDVPTGPLVRARAIDLYSLERMVDRYESIYRGAPWA